jgi:Cdc6-like AAA superfamily ATPase
MTLEKKLVGSYRFYNDALYNLILNSNSNLTIGIYGEWGVGKTTLMDSVYSKLKNEKNKDVVPIWFNAWQYERETNFALIPLLLEIAGVINDNENDAKKELKKTLLNVCKSLLKNSPGILSFILPGVLMEPYKAIVNGIPQLNNKTESSIDNPNKKVADELIYSSGLKEISNKIAKIRENEKEYKIVVFIDDLDRCSQKKILEMFESVKVFLDMIGFIFILGIDQNRLSLIIEREYGKEERDYLDRVIQVPINLPPWDEDGIKNIIDNLVRNDTDHGKFITDNIDVITWIEKNPGQINRLIENLLFTLHVYHYTIFPISPVSYPMPNFDNEKKKEEIKEFVKKLIIIQIINFKWNDVYDLILDSNDLERKRAFRTLHYINSLKYEPEILQKIGYFFNANNKKIKWLIKKYKDDDLLHAFFEEYSEEIDNDDLLKKIKVITQVSSIHNKPVEKSINKNILEQKLQDSLSENTKNEVKNKMSRKERIINKLKFWN